MLEARGKILITGGAGYIGSVLTPFLLAHGYEVVVIDNFRYHQNSLLDCCHDPKLKVIRGDARDRELVKSELPGVDFIIPLAALVGAPVCDQDPRAALSTNLEAIKFLLELRREEQGIIFPNTNSGYGIGQKDVYCDETTPLKPISLYGRTKVEAENDILKTPNAVSLRLATVFGVSPRMRTDLIVNDFVHRAMHDRFIVLFEAHFKRNYIHIRDVARAFLHVIQNFPKLRNQVYNVGLSDANLSKLELCAEIKKQIPDFYFVTAEIGSDPDKRNYIVSNEKFERTGFRPAVSLTQGIKELIKAYEVLDGRRFGNV